MLYSILNVRSKYFYVIILLYELISTFFKMIKKITSIQTILIWSIQFKNSSPCSYLFLKCWIFNAKILTKRIFSIKFNYFTFQHKRTIILINSSTWILFFAILCTYVIKNILITFRIGTKEGILEKPGNAQSYDYIEVL